jgi:putative transposase
LRPARRRRYVGYLEKQYGVSQRHACRLVGLSRSVHRYTSYRDRQEALRGRLKELAAARPRYGYLRLHVLLRREGWMVNRKRIYRLYLEEGLQVRTKKRRKCASHTRLQLPQASHIDERWSMDFVSDALMDGRRFRVLTIIDLFSRECVGLVANFSLKGDDVVNVLDALRARGRTPGFITVDNGSEFASKPLDAWAFNCSVKLDFIRPGKPVENAYIESFNGRLRDECLNMNLFFTLADVRGELEQWKHDYNTVRPHRALGGLSPSEAQAMQTDGADGKTKEQFSHSSLNRIRRPIHSSHSLDDGYLSIEDGDNTEAAQAAIRGELEGLKHRVFRS